MTKEAYVIGDLHLGAGPQDPLEDFHQDVAFVKFVRRLSHDGITLFINGDFIDFAQIPPFETAQPEHLLWNEQASLAKLATAFEAHALCFDALAEMIEGGGRLVIIIGNHDFDFAWERVQTAFRKRLGDPEGKRLQFIIGSTVYHGVLIEHGYQFTEENCPQDPASFIHRWPAGREDSERYLERVWGTAFMLSFYNDLERLHPYADCIKPTIAALYYGVRNRWVGAKDLINLIRFLKGRGVPWNAISSVVLSAETLNINTVVGSFADSDWRAVIVERLHKDPEFARDLAGILKELNKDDQRIMALDKRIEVEGPIPTEDGATLGVFRDSREVRAAQRHLKNAGVNCVVFGHTHVEVDGGLQGCLFNPGTWIPHLNLKSEHVRHKIRTHGLTLDILNDKSLFDVRRRSVHIVPEEEYRARVAIVNCD